MEKEENKISEENNSETKTNESLSDNNIQSKSEEDNVQESEQKKPEEIILELEDKLARTFAEMENQRRRFEKEREDAFNYGGFTFAKETLNLIDNLERSKKILESDEALKNSDALKKTLEHFDIINKDMVSIL